MSEIKQDWRKNEDIHFKLSYIYRDNFGEVDDIMGKAQDVLDELLSQALQKRDDAILKEAEKKVYIGIGNKPEFIIKLKDLENIIKSKL